MRRTLVLASFLAVTLALCAVPGQRAVATAPEPVEVTNFPAIQKVTGNVVVTEPVPQTRLETRQALVSPAELADISNLTEVGRLSAEGFSHVTLGVAGTLQGNAPRGAVGVLLVPDVPDITTAMRTYGVIQFPLRVEAAVAPSRAGLFSSDSFTFRLAFPRYRVFFYNSTPRSAETTLYAYLGTS